MSDVVMPRLSDSMEEGTILRWLKANGEEVKRGEELAEIETDKATMAYESDSDGVLEIVASEGTTLPVGELIARIGDGSPAATPAAEERSAAGRGRSARGLDALADRRRPIAAAPSENGGSAAAPPAADDDRVKASPLARRLARERGSTYTRLPEPVRAVGSSELTSKARRAESRRRQSPRPRLPRRPRQRRRPCRPQRRPPT